MKKRPYNETYEIGRHMRRTNADFGPADYRTKVIPSGKTYNRKRQVRENQRLCRDAGYNWR